jgi:hypothetical protein
MQKTKANALDRCLCTCPRNLLAIIKASMVYGMFAWSNASIESGLAVNGDSITTGYSILSVC